MTLPRFWRTAVVGATVGVLCLGPLPMAAADGPGYGGDAGALAVTWVASTDAAPATATPTQPDQPAPSTSTPAPVDQPATTSTSTPAQTDQPATASTPADQPASASTPADQPATSTQNDQPEATPPADQPASTSTPADQPANTSTPADQPATSTDAPVPSAMSFGGGARGVAAAFALPATDPALTPDAMSLMVRGLGFRSKSKIQVRIGSDLPVETRADTAGALAVALDPRKLGGAQPGVSVMAVGRNQSGTEVTLFGSVPPVADGSGPMSLVPWGVACVALVGLAAWIRRRHATHGAPDLTDPA